MSYYLQNLETMEIFCCEDHEWIGAIETALENGWQADGTVYDLFYETEDQCDDTDNLMYYYHVLIGNMNESAEWDGNYIQKKNQIVLYEDTLYLADDLKNSSIRKDLLEFIYKGSFRICSV